MSCSIDKLDGGLPRGKNISLTDVGDLTLTERLGCYAETVIKRATFINYFPSLVHTLT